MKGFLRVWENIDLEDVEKHLIVVGDLSSECFACHKIGLDLKVSKCPECGTVFKYMGFRRKLQMPYLKKVKEDMLDIICIDFDDFKKSLGKRDARKILNI